MATVIFADGFDHYDTANILAKWDERSGATIEATTPRTVGSSYLKLTSYTNYVRKNIASVNTIDIGFGVYLDQLDDNHRGFRLSNMDGEQVTIRINIDGSVSIVRGSYNGPLLATSAAGLFRALTWNWFEFKITIDNAAGSYEVKLNGQSILSGSGVDTQARASSGCTIVSLYGISVGNPIYLDDLVFADDFVEDTRIDTKFSDGAGNYSQFTPSAGSNEECIDDSIPDDDGTYNKSSTAGHMDTFTFDDISVIGSTIHAVVIDMWARKDDSESRSARGMTRISSTDYAGSTTHYMSGDYKCYQEIFNVSPATSSAWTEAEVNGAEFGYELVA